MLINPMFAPVHVDCGMQDQFPIQAAIGRPIEPFIVGGTGLPEGRLDGKHDVRVRRIHFNG